MQTTQPRPTLRALTPLWWSRFNRFQRQPLSPSLEFKPLSGDVDTVRLLRAGKTIGTLNRRPHDWFEIVSLEGRGARATTNACDIEGFLLQVVRFDRSLTAVLEAFGLEQI